MLSFSLGSGANKRDHSDNGHDHASDSEATAAAAAAPGEESSRSIVEEAISSPRRPAAQPLSAAASISSSLRGRSRSPSGSPMSHRRTTGAGIGHTEGPSQLPTIPSASNIYASNLNAFVSLQFGPVYPPSRPRSLHRTDPVAARLLGPNHSTE